jgi:polygalacturonase
MDNINPARRELLKLGSLGIAATTPAFAFAAAQGPARKPTSSSTSPLLHDVRTYGATGDGKTLDTAAINKAIETAAAGGGGTVVFPAGNYLSFSIRLKSNVELHLTQGATIIAADSPLPGQNTGYNGGTYDPAEPKTSYDAYQDYGHNHWHNSLIWGEDLHDIAITGTGLIWGKGLSFGAGPGRPPAAAGATGRGFGAETPNSPVPLNTPPTQRPARGNYPMYQAEQPGVGNKAIALKNCRNVQLREFSVLKGGHFALLLTGVDNLIIDNLTIDTDRDGMDIDCCKNVRVSNCTVNSPWDDGICPKSSFALGYNRPTENLTITNCFVSGCYHLGTVLDGTFKKFDGTTDQNKIGGTGRIKCGTESNGGFKNVTISNCVFEGCQGLALETVDGALLEDFTVSNLTMRDIISCPIFMRLGARLRGPKGAVGTDQSTVVGTLRRIIISNVTSYNTAGRYGSHITGIPNFNVEDIKLSNFYVETAGGGTAEQAKIEVPEKEDAYPEPSMLGTLPTYGFYLRHVNRVEMSHVEIQPKTPDARPAIFLDDVHRADFFAITAPTTTPAFAFNKSTDIRIAFSRAAKDTILATADNQRL